MHLRHFGEARNETYKRYGEVSTGGKMAKMHQEHQQSSQLCWLVNWCGPEAGSV
jgi:hypothetical protein